MRLLVRCNISMHIMVMYVERILQCFPLLFCIFFLHIMNWHIVERHPPNWRFIWQKLIQEVVCVAENFKKQERDVKYTWVKGIRTMKIHYRHSINYQTMWPVKCRKNKFLIISGFMTSGTYCFNSKHETYLITENVRIISRF